MNPRRSVLIVAALLLFIVGVGLWVVSTRVSIRDFFPGRAQESLSLAELNQVQVRYQAFRYGAYAAGVLGLICLIAGFQPTSRPRPARSSIPARKTLIACAVSGVLSGLVSSVHTGGSSFLAQPLFYAAGWVFGYCFARVNIKGPTRVVLFTIASGLIYWAAVHVYSAFASSLSVYSPFMEAVKVLPGLIGGLGLAVSLKLVTGSPLTLRDEGGAAIIGALIGFVFFWLYWIPVPGLGLALAFASWQVPMGWLLSAQLERAAVDAPALGS